MATEVKRITKEGKYSYGIQVKTSKEEFVIPVIDVRDGQHERNKVNTIIKNLNFHSGSKYMRPSYSVRGLSYQISHKK